MCASPGIRPRKHSSSFEAHSGRPIASSSLGRSPSIRKLRTRASKFALCRLAGPPVVINRPISSNRDPNVPVSGARDSQHRASNGAPEDHVARFKFLRIGDLAPSRQNLLYPFDASDLSNGVARLFKYCTNGVCTRQQPRETQTNIAALGCPVPSLHAVKTTVVLRRFWCSKRSIAKPLRKWLRAMMITTEINRVPGGRRQQNEPQGVKHSLFVP